MNMIQNVELMTSYYYYFSANPKEQKNDLLTTSIIVSQQYRIHLIIYRKESNTQFYIVI